MKANTTASVILEKRINPKDTQHPVKLRVTHKRKPKYYVLKYPAMNESGFKDLYGQSIYMSEEDYRIMGLIDSDFKAVKAKKSAKWYNTYRLMFAAFESRAIEEISKLKPFTFEVFEEKYFDKPKDDQDIFAAITSKATALRSEGKIGTARIYESTLNSLRVFTDRDKYPFGNITVPFLKKYETWMKGRKIGRNEREGSKTTTSIYLRSLKAVFNESAPYGVVCPFGKGKYKIPGGKHNKRALTQADVAKIANYNAPDGSMLQRSRDLWLFSFLCNGINFKDMALLKYSNIHDDTIVFSRAKTAENSSDTIDITVVITRQIGRIIDTWGNKPADPDQYIFPILHKGTTIDDLYRDIAQAIKNTNKYIKRICTDLEIPIVTTYAARHSFATVLKRSGASVEFISESLGHTNIATTQNYLANFEIDEKRKWAEMLLPDNNQ